MLTASKFKEQLKEIRNKDGIEIKEFRSERQLNSYVIPEEYKGYYYGRRRGSCYYDVRMFEICTDENYAKYLHYKENCNLTPVMPEGYMSCYYMFAGCSKMTQLDLSNFNTIDVFDMSGMFYGCKSLTRLDLSGFDTSKVKYMSDMFSDCKSLTSLDLSSFDTSKVIDTSRMFYGCESLTELDLSNLDVSRVMDISGMFAHCESLIKLDLPKYNLRNDIYLVGMFDGCKTLQSVKSEDIPIQREYIGERVKWTF